MSHVDPLDPFTTAYLECAIWSSTDDDGNPLDREYELADLSLDSRRDAIADCTRFQETCAHLLSGLDASQCGHDYWLTRNGHGAGFWDRGLGEVGDKLTEAAKAAGSADLYLGDDGKLYLA